MMASGSVVLLAVFFGGGSDGGIRSREVLVLESTTT